jgi:hypothetical protein
MNRTNTEVTKFNNIILIIDIFVIVVINYIYQGICYEYSDIKYHIIGMNNINANSGLVLSGILKNFIVKFSILNSDNFYLGVISLSFWMAIATLLKIYIIKKIIDRFLKAENRLNLYISILFAFVNPLPLVNLISEGSLFHGYKGYMMQNTWHNPTLILVMPFSLLLYVKSYDLIKKFDSKLFLSVLILILINLTIKPSYIFVFLPVYSIYILLNTRTRIDVRYYMPILISLLIIFISYSQLYISDQSTLYAGQSHGVSIKPLHYLAHVNDNNYAKLVLNFIVSNIIVLYAMINLISQKGIRYIFRDRLLYAKLTYIFALLISILFIETGPRMWHGNFLWQNYIAQTVLIITYYIEYVKLPVKKANNIVFFSLLGIHFLWGVFYFLKYLLYGGWLVNIFAGN